MLIKIVVSAALESLCKTKKKSRKSQVYKVDIIFTLTQRVTEFSFFFYLKFIFYCMNNDSICTAWLYIVKRYSKYTYNDKTMLALELEQQQQQHSWTLLIMLLKFWLILLTFIICTLQ